MNVTIYGTREQWLAARQNPTVIGASEAAAVLGVHPHMTAWDLWETKRGRSGEHRDGDVLRRGNRWESAVLAEYEDASGMEVIHPGAHFGQPGSLVTIASVTHPWLRQSPDAFARDPRSGAMGQVEAKTAMDRDAWSPEGGVVIERWAEGAELLVPAHYAVQAYVQMHASGMPWNDACALVPHGGWLAVRWVRILRDEETQGEIVEALAAWRHDYLVGDATPPLDGSRACNRFLASAYKAREARVATDDEASAMRELASLREQIATAKARVDELSNQLIASANGSRLRLTDAKTSPYGQPQKSDGRTTLDVERVRKEFPEAFEACAKRSAASASFNLYRFNKESGHVE